MKIIYTTILLLISLVTYSQTDSTTKSKVYILRATGFTGSARQFKIFVDGNLTCKIQNDKYLVLEISTGKHSFAVQMDGKKLRKNTDKVEILTEAGKNYYLSSVLITDAAWSKTQMDELTENSAKAKMMKLERVNCSE